MLVEKTIAHSMAGGGPCGAPAPGWKGVHQVDVDTEGGQLQGQTSCEGLDSPLGRRVTADAGKASEAHAETDVVFP